MKKKKKYKTLYIRKIRNRSNNKRAVRYFEKFSSFFDYFFYLKRNIIKKKTFVNFLKRFHFSGLQKIYRFIKLFGLKKNYKMNVLYFRSNYNVYVIKKFKRKKLIKKKSLKKFKNVKILKLIYKRDFKKFRKEIKLKNRNIVNKKALCLHVSYRHLLGLPVRGQRTKTNARTRKDFKIT